MAGVLITWQGDKLGTIESAGDSFTYTGDKTSMINIVQEFRKDGEAPLMLLKRLPIILHGTMSAIPYDDTPPKLLTRIGL